MRDSLINSSLNLFELFFRGKFDLASCRSINEVNPKWAALRILFAASLLGGSLGGSGGRHINLPIFAVWSQFIGWRVFVMVMEAINSQETGGLLQILDTTEGQSTVPFFGITQVCAMAILRNEYQGNKSIPRSKMLLTCWRCKATDERDHVFALQGITSAASQNALVPDYSLEL